MTEFVAKIVNGFKPLATLNAENIMQRKCRTRKKSGKILCNTRNIFFVGLFIFHLCMTFNMLNFH